MMLKKAPLLFLPLIAWLILSGACKSNAVNNDPLPPDSAYFSMNQFIKDQITTYYGAPYTLYRISYLDGAKDSTLVNFFNMDWAAILGTFSATDIAARKFLGKYDFSMYDDNTSGERGFVYTANDPEMFTRRLMINSDPVTNRITSIYIETARKDFFSNKTQKLLYVPLGIIQIQETEGSLFGKARNLRVEYQFMQDDRETEL